MKYKPTRLSRCLHFCRDGKRRCFGGAELSAQNFISNRFPLFNFQLVSVDDFYPFVRFRLTGFLYIETVLRFIFLRIIRLFNSAFLFFRLPYSRTIDHQDIHAELVSAHGTEVVLLHALGVKVDFYFFRSEYDIFEYRNYRVGFFKYLKVFCFIFEYPFGRLYNFLLFRALEDCESVISNSEFMKTKVNSLNIRSKVIYPVVSVPQKKLEFTSEEVNFLDRYDKKILLMAYEEVKGRRIMNILFKSFPSFGFIVVDRSLNKVKIIDNVLFLPHAPDNVGYLYIANILLIPSIWQESFGRVAVEAGLTGIQVVASKVGGLPESCNSNAILIENYNNPKEWIKVLREYLE